MHNFLSLPTKCILSIQFDEAFNRNCVPVVTCTCKISLVAKFCGKFTHRNNKLIRFLICIVYTLSMSDNNKFNLNLKEILLKVCNEYL